MWQAFFLCAGARRAWRLILGLLTLITLVLALWPTPPVKVGTGWDKSNHLLAFASLGWAGFFAAGASTRGTRAMATALLAFGGLIEVLQSFIPPRSGEWGDLLADGLGIGIGLLVARAVDSAMRRV